MIRLNTKHSSDQEQLQVWHPPALVLEFCYGFAARIPAEQLHFGRQLILSPPLALPELSHLRANNVQL